MPRRLELTVHLSALVGPRPVAVTGGIPFPRGALSATDRLRLLDERGRELPLQTEPLATWSPDREQVRWLLLDFQLANLPAGASRLTLEHGPDVGRAAPVPAVDPWASRWPPEALVGGMYLTDQHGTEYRTALDPDPIIAVETRGPLRTVVRAQVWHVSEDGARSCRAVVRLHYYAGLDVARIVHGLVMDADPREFSIASMGLRLPVPGASGPALIAGEQGFGRVHAAVGPVALLQDRDDHFETSGAVSTQGRRSGTWLCVGCERGGGTAAFIRQGWERFPKGLAWDGRELDVQLWPVTASEPLDLGPIPGSCVNATTEDELREALAEHPEASVSLYRFVTRGQTDWTSDTVVPLMRRARELEAELLGGRFAYYYLLFGGHGQGAMVRSEVVLVGWEGNTSADELNATAEHVRRPPVLCASPEWSCASGAFGPSLPFEAGAFPEVDRAMTWIDYQAAIEFRDRLRLYGALDYGDYINGNPAMAGAIYEVYGADHPVRISDRIGWNNTESHDSAVGAWAQSLRTADPALFDFAETVTAHLASFDQRHVLGDDGLHRAIARYHAMRHYDGGDAPHHTLSGGYLLGYFVTGDGFLRETALANAEFFLEAQQADGSGWYAPCDLSWAPSRQNSAPLTCLLNAYTLTWDQRYRESITRFLEVWAPIHDVTNPSHYMGGTLPYPGAEYARLVDDEPFRHAFHRMMDDLRTRMPIDGQSAYYLPGMVYVWEVTGEVSYLGYCLFVMMWHADRLATASGSDWVHRRIFDLPDMQYGYVTGHLATGLAAIETARARGVDLDAAMEELRRDRAAAMGVAPEEALYYSVYGTLEGSAGRWYLPCGGPTEGAPG